MNEHMTHRNNTRRQEMALVSIMYASQCEMKWINTTDEPRITRDSNTTRPSNLQPETQTKRKETIRGQALLTRQSRVSQGGGIVGWMVAYNRRAMSATMTVTNIAICVGTIVVPELVLLVVPASP